MGLTCILSTNTFLVGSLRKEVTFFLKKKKKPLCDGIYNYLERKISNSCGTPILDTCISVSKGVPIIELLLMFSRSIRHSDI